MLENSDKKKSFLIDLLSVSTHTYELVMYFYAHFCHSHAKWKTFGVPSEWKFSKIPHHHKMGPVWFGQALLPEIADTASLHLDTHMTTNGKKNMPTDSTTWCTHRTLTYLNTWTAHTYATTHAA